MAVSKMKLSEIPDWVELEPRLEQFMNLYFPVTIKKRWLEFLEVALSQGICLEPAGYHRRDWQVALLNHYYDLCNEILPQR